jgi:hypothetical protein
MTGESSCIKCPHAHPANIIYPTLSYFYCSGAEDVARTEEETHTDEVEETLVARGGFTETTGAGVDTMGGAMTATITGEVTISVDTTVEDEVAEAGVGTIVLQEIGVMSGNLFEAYIKK